MLTYVHYAIITATILTGLFALLAPNRIEGFTGISPVGGRGLVEIRAIFGGLFIGLGLAALIAGPGGAYLTLGIAYLAIAAVRLPAMFIDRSFERSNWISLAVEIVFGVLLLL
jgi:hypothetical protein